MKTIKRVGLFVLVLTLCLNLSGCLALDDLRAHQGFWQPDGSIRWGEQYYRLLPDCEELRPTFSYEFGAPQVSVTDPDVPVLASAVMGEKFDISEDELFLEGGNGFDVWDDSIPYPLYCREDKYDEVVSRIEKGFEPEIYFYTYDVYNEEEYTFEEKYYDLTEAEVDAVRYVFTEVIPKTLEEGFSFDSEEALCLTAATSDRLFQKEMLYLESVGQAYYLSVYQDDGTTLLYAVPTDMRQTFDGIFAAYRRSMEDWLEEEEIETDL